MQNFMLRVRMPQDLRDFLFEYAEKNDSDASKIIRKLLRDFKKKQDQVS